MCVWVCVWGGGGCVCVCVCVQILGHIYGPVELITSGEQCYVHNEVDPKSEIRSQK